MEINQIYSIVNSVTAQAMGTNELTVVDEQGLVALGNTVLSSSTNTENFLNTLVQRIGRTIFSYRMYRSTFRDLLRDDFEWGAILQKIKVSMPTAEADQSYDLEDGASVDMYKIAKPKATQKLFVSETPYQFHVTIQRKHLKEAFLSNTAMSGFISSVFGEVQNKIELALESLGRNCLNNYIAEVNDKTTRHIKLVTLYNTLTGAEVTSETAMQNADFLRWAVGQIKLYSRRMTSMSTLYNDGSETRHTPKDMQKLYVLADFETSLETVVQYQAFQDEYVKLDGFKELPYLQSAKTPMNVDIKRASDGSEQKVNNVIAMLFDRESLGTYKEDEWTSTTPFNSAGGYTNTYWHMKEMYFNDLSENFLLFTLN